MALNNIIKRHHHHGAHPHFPSHSHKYYYPSAKQHKTQRMQYCVYICDVYSVYTCAPMIILYCIEHIRWGENRPHAYILFTLNSGNIVSEWKMIEIEIQFDNNRHNTVSFINQT